MSEPLSDAEVAELRRLETRAVDSVPALGEEVGRLIVTRDQAAYFLAMAKALPRLLSELEQLRRRDREQAAGEEVLRQQVRDMERARELLRRIEQISVEGEPPSCPDCGAESKAKFGPDGSRTGWAPRHETDCELAALIR